MLQQTYQIQDPNELHDDQSLTLERLYDVIKRRLLFAVIVLVLVFGVGAVITALLPAIYVSEGKMLIESQEIPTDLVQPTVSTVADERVALLQQRLMVRDKLLAIADKYKLAEFARKRFLGRWRPEMSATDIVDMMRDSTQIKPAKNEIAGRPGQRQFIAFTVSFEHEQPEIARLVANELITTLLDEDARARNSSALETTRFLQREEKRLEAEVNSVEAKLADAKNRETRDAVSPAGSVANQLMTLKAELVIKSASYSDAHPDVKALKQKIAALEKTVAKTPDTAAVTEDVSVEALERRHASLNGDLESISKKLAAARLGENLERGQHSERLSVIEQPTLPQNPLRPNRPKILAVVFALAIAASGGLVSALEMFDGTIRRNADFAKLVESQLIVSIPYISTKTEILRQKSRKFWLVIGCIVGIILAGFAAAIYLLHKYGLF